MPLYGDGLNIRDWCYVEDNCAGVDLVLRRGEIGEIYNIGGGNEITNRELTDRILATLGAGDEMIEYVEDRLGHDRRYSIDCSKMRALGWAPERELERGPRSDGRLVPRQPLVVGTPEGGLSGPCGSSSPARPDNSATISSPNSSAMASIR